MKRLLLSLAIIVSIIAQSSAQGERIFLFDKFYNATVYMKNNNVTKSALNYDANNGKVYFIQGEDLMELTNLAQVDSIVVDERLFVAGGGDIMEKFETPNGTVHILWRIHKIHDGYVGAFGTTSQVPSKKLQLPGNLGLGTLSGSQGGMYNGSFGTNEDEDGGRNLDVWHMKTENEYIFTRNGKEYKVKRTSQLYKAFPDRKDRIKEYAKEHKLDFTSAEKALILIDYALSL